MPRLLVLAPVLLLALAGCGKDAPTVATPTAPATPTATVTATATATAGPTPTATSALPPGVDQLVSFAVRGGRVAGPAGRVKVKLGSTVRLVVASDKADEVHLHGYDKTVDVAAGGTAQLTFTASIPGVFEVELENSKVTITRLQVQ